MHLTNDFVILLSRLEGPSPQADELIAALRDAGLAVESEERENTPSAGVQWLLPTAFFLYLADKYFGAALGELAKDSYRLAKPHLLRFLKRTVGPAREVRVSWVVSSSTPNKLSPERPAAVAVYATLRSGHQIKFAFDDTMDAAVHESALDGLMEALSRHYAGSPEDLLAPIAARTTSRGSPIVMRFDQTSSVWYNWSPFHDRVE